LYKPAEYKRATSSYKRTHSRQFGLVCVFVALFVSSCGGSYEPSEDNIRSAENDASSSSNAVVASSLGVAGSADDIYLADSAIGRTDNNNLCAGFIGDTERYPVPRLERPPFLEYYRDPTFGAKVIRISDGVAGEVNKPVYSTMQAWNADESLLLLYRTGVQGGGHFLHDGFSYERIRELDIAPSDLEDVFWSYKDPEAFYYISREETKSGHFLRTNAITDEEELIVDLGTVCGANSTPIAGYDVQMQSHDDDVFGFRCKNNNDDSRSVSFTYRISDGHVDQVRTGAGTEYDGRIAPMVAPSGERFLLPPEQLSQDLTETAFTLDLAKNEHSSMGLNSEGKDAYFVTTFAPSPRGCDDEMWRGVGPLVEFNIEDNTCRTVLSQRDGWPPTLSGTHVSATAYKRPGWVAMSSIGYKDLHYLHMDAMEAKNAPALFSEIFLVNTDPEEHAVCRLAQHRSLGKSARNGGYAPYFGEPHPTISPSGTRIIFGSDWYDSGTVDAYVIELPAYRAPDI